METQTFNVSIDAPRTKVWDILWNDDTYREWTSVFSEGSQVQTDWEKGSKVLFLDGNGSGMTSVIADKIPNEYMSFKHMGEVKDGVEDFDSAASKGWAGSMENYTLKDADGKTDLIVELDINNEYKDYFMNTFPKALNKVKEIAERK